MKRISDLRNLGPKSEQWLNAIGIFTLDDLRRSGSIGAYRQLRAAGFNVSPVMIYAIEGALTGFHWNDLPAEVKERLKVEAAKAR